MSLKDDEPITYRQLESTGVIGRNRSVRSLDPVLSAMMATGRDFRTADRAVTMSRYWGISPVEIIDRNL